LEEKVEEELNLHTFVNNYCCDLFFEQRIFYSELLKIFQGTSSKLLCIDTNYISTINHNYMKTLFYASEDELDQGVTKGCMQLKISGVVLGRMAGGTRVVTEVLDCRSREESLEELVWNTI
jgi:hypothetical protein